MNVDLDHDPRLAYDDRGDPLCRSCGEPNDIVAGSLDCIDCEDEDLDISRPATPRTLLDMTAGHDDDERRVEATLREWPERDLHALARLVSRAWVDPMRSVPTGG